MDNLARKQEDSSPRLRASVANQRDLPDYLPARMVNEFVYCPRLFFYEWVDGVFRESVDTVEGKFQHQRVDAERERRRPGKTTDLPKPEETAAEEIHSRSVTLSSDRHRVIAKIDLVESAAGGIVRDEEPQGSTSENSALPLNGQSTIDNRPLAVTPVDYKHGQPLARLNVPGLQAVPAG
jgi:CRISPR/Cas system-associated exonuclease Cas4 (RecB family)